MRRAVALLTLLAFAGCTSTQEKARRLKDEGRGAFEARGLRLGRANPDVRVLDTAVLSDRNGSAAVVVLRNRVRREQVRVPVAIDVRGADGKSVFRNDAPGLEPSLVSVSLLGPGDTVGWVYDQVVATSRPKSLRARVGPSHGKAPAEPPRLRVRGVRLEHEQTTGLSAQGTVTNDSRVDQRDLVLYGVARRGGRIVAAGRAQVRRVKPGGRAAFRMFFIGDPRDAELSISVPPTRF